MKPCKQRINIRIMALGLCSPPRLVMLPSISTTASLVMNLTKSPRMYSAKPQKHSSKKARLAKVYIYLFAANFPAAADEMNNFTVEPIQMLEHEDGAQISANFITNNDEKFLIHLESTAMADLRSFKNALAKKTFTLTFMGGSGDLDHFKMFLCDIGWTKKRGVKATGIYPRNSGRNLYSLIQRARWVLAA